MTTIVVLYLGWLVNAKALFYIAKVDSGDSRREFVLKSPLVLVPYMYPVLLIGCWYRDKVGRW